MFCYCEQCKSKTWAILDNSFIDRTRYYCGNCKMTYYDIIDSKTIECGFHTSAMPAACLTCWLVFDSKTQYNKHKRNCPGEF